MTPSQASKKSKEKVVYSNPKDKRQKLVTKFKSGQLIRTAYTDKFFSKGDSTNWSHKIYTIT